MKIDLCLMQMLLGFDDVLRHVMVKQPFVLRLKYKLNLG